MENTQDYQDYQDYRAEILGHACGYLRVYR